MTDYEEALVLAELLDRARAQGDTTEANRLSRELAQVLDGE